MFGCLFVENERWSMVKTTGPSPCGRSRAKAVVYDNKMMLFGGWDRKDYFSDLFQFDFGTKNKEKNANF